MKVYHIKKGSMFKLSFLFLFILISVIWTSVNSNEAINVFSPKKELPIYCVETKEKKVAISFDAAWGIEHTENILDALDKYDVKTTFFLVEFWARKHPDMVKAIHDRGHEIGNHSATHPKMSTLNESKIIDELKKTENVIKEITGERTILFRPPFGDYNNRLIRTCKENNYYVIQWDVDSLDWKEFSVDSVVNRVTKNVKNGSIVLFHNNAKYISEFLPIVLQKLTEEGYKIVPVSELIYKDNYYIDHTGKQIKRINNDNN